MHQIVHSFLSFAFLLILQNIAIHCQDEKDQKSKDILRQIAYNTELTYSAFHKGAPESPDSRYNAFHKSMPELADSTYRAFTKNHPEFGYVDREKTSEILYGGNNYKIRYFRTKRASVERSLESIRKRLNEERKRERDELLMAADANPRMDTNDTSGTGKHGLVSFEYGEFYK